MVLAVRQRRPKIRIDLKIDLHYGGYLLVESKDDLTLMNDRYLTLDLKIFYIWVERRDGEKISRQVLMAKWYHLGVVHHSGTTSWIWRPNDRC